MDEKLKELLNKCGLRFVMYSVPVITFTDIELKRFAELIVKECAKFLDENSGSNECNNVWYPEPEELLQYFGVEN
jgi:hypothetical protein